MRMSPTKQTQKPNTMDILEPSLSLMVDMNEQATMQIAMGGMNTQPTMSLWIPNSTCRLTAKILSVKQAKSIMVTQPQRVRHESQFFRNTLQFTPFSSFLCCSWFSSESCYSFYSSDFLSWFLMFSEASLGSMMYWGMRLRNKSNPTIRKVYMYPTKEYKKDANTGPTNKPTPMAYSAKPMYFSWLSQNSYAIREKPN